MQFLTRSQVLAQVRKTVHAERNGFILKVTASNLCLAKERTRGSCRRYGLVIRPRNVEPGAS